MMGNPLNIMIAMPAHGGMIKNKSVETVVKLVHALMQHGIKFKFATTTFADIVIVRNMFASMVLNDPAFTHLLFIDYDMCFEPRGVLKMLRANKAIVGWVYPMRQTPPNFVIKNPRHTVDGSIVSADGVGTGVMLIKRDALQMISASDKLTVQTDHLYQGHGYDGPILGFFDHIYEDGRRLGEDYSFCKRWRSACNGEIYGLIDEKIGHIGEHTYSGSYIEFIKDKIQTSSQFQSASVVSPQAPA